MKFRNIKIFLFSILIITFLSCGDNKNSSSNQNNETENYKPEDPTLVKFNGKLFSIPSPIQLAILTKKMNLALNLNILNESSKYKNYNTNFKQALNIGVYGADLAYLNIYEQLSETSKYISVVKKMSNDLGIINSFRQETIKRLEQNNNDRDSLVYILSTIYRDIDAYLLDNNRTNISVLVIAGGWLESIYLMTQLLESSKNQEIVNRVGEQKKILENLIELLRPYYQQDSDDFDKLLEDLSSISSLFENIKNDYTYTESVTDESKKLTIINSTTNSTISDADLNKIIAGIKTLRNWVVE